MEEVSKDGDVLVKYIEDSNDKESFEEDIEEMGTKRGKCRQR